jgi:2'-5' RNA ligase
VSRPNWFFAFPLDGAFLGELPPVPTAFRRFHVEDVHCTLAFLGGCGEEGAERALLLLDELLRASPRSAISFSLGEVVPMGGSRRDYSALSALLDTGRAETEACIAELGDPLLEAATGRRAKRKPKAHVTLARPMRRATDAQRQAGLAWAESIDLRAVRGQLERVALYTWDATRRERLFKIAATRSLSGGTP